MWVRGIPSTNTGWAENELRAALGRRTWGAGEAQYEWGSCTHSSIGQHPKPRGQQEREGILPCSGETPPAELPSALGPPKLRRTGTCWSTCRRSRVSPVRQPKSAGVVQFYRSLSLPKGRLQGSNRRSFARVCNDRTRSNGFKLNKNRFKIMY